MAATIMEKRQDEFLSTLRKGQDITLDALKTLVETIQYVAPKMPAIHVPTAREVVAVSNEFAEHLLANQREFADEVITTLSPLLPDRYVKPAASSEGRPAAKAGKPAAA
jgi:hypothetical protein